MLQHYSINSKAEVHMMNLDKKIRVLVVDDSLLFREVLSRGISSNPNIQVVAKAVDPFDARDKILKFRPDVMTCDVQMPKMNGIDFIRRLLPQYSLPVIVVSTVSEAVFDAMNAGAVDFVTKPDMRSVEKVEYFIHDIIDKIKIAANAHVVEGNNIRPHSSFVKNAIKTDKVIAIGASTGGTQAINRVLEEFPAQMPPIVIVQHIPALFSQMFAKRLDSSLSLNVKEAQGGEILEPGRVLIAPGDRHMKLVRIGRGLKVELSDAEKVNGHKPSVDVLFESVARECNANAVGVILTGMGYDGAKGLLAMKRKGAMTIGQDEKSSVVYGMPKVAFNIGAVKKQVPLEKIPHEIFSLLR